MPGPKKNDKDSKELDGSHFAGMTLKWNYSPNHAKRSCCLSVLGYICNVRANYKHSMPIKRQLSPHKHHEISMAKPPNSPMMNPTALLSPQKVSRESRALLVLSYACEVDNKLLATLSTLSSQQATTTKATNDAITQLLDYLATYPNDGSTYCASNMILCAHADNGFHNESKGHGRAGAHIFVLENNLFPKHNSPVLSFSQIVKFVMPSATEAKQGTLKTTAKEMPPSVILSSKWVGLSHTLPSKLTTALPLVSPTSPLSMKDQVHGPSLMVALMPRIPTSVSLLLGERQPQLGRLPHQTPPTHLP